MKLYLLGFTLLIGALNAESPPLFVSLGSHCEVAVKLRENGLRLKAYPFDWITTFDAKGFIQLLDEDFQHFVSEEQIIQHPYRPDYLENTCYQVEFRHEWPFLDHESSILRFVQQLSYIQNKYERRIDRFRQLASYPGKVFFIRTAFDFENDPHSYWAQERHARITKEEAEALKEALQRYFPSLDFTLVIINYTEEYARDITGVDRVIECKIRKSDKHGDYRRLFEALNLFAQPMDN
ncbi:MAG: hypothetical protein HYX48_06425 [Chlamydiales bacterium]|nr:hypothetical protein [Chlamydiales bacterium]